MVLRKTENVPRQVQRQPRQPVSLAASALEGTCRQPRSSLGEQPTPSTFSWKMGLQACWKYEYSMLIHWSMAAVRCGSSAWHERHGDTIAHCPSAGNEGRHALAREPLPWQRHHLAGVERGALSHVLEDGPGLEHSEGLVAAARARLLPHGHLAAGKRCDAQIP